AAVNLSAITRAIQPGYRIVALQMAPDAVRAALLVSTPADGIRLLLAAVLVQSGTAMFGQPVTVGTTGLTDPAAISWYDAYHLAVLASGGIYDIPLTGGAGQQPSPQLMSALPTNSQTLTLTTDGTELVVGTTAGVWAEPVSAPGTWLPFATNGSNPVYPG
ncbi:MAG TPA: LpqB family beta-propeller domain-containing protein, partial [Streptosporangiaceae bacterium]